MCRNGSSRSFRTRQIKGTTHYRNQVCSVLFLDRQLYLFLLLDGKRVDANPLSAYRVLGIDLIAINIFESRDLSSWNLCAFDLLSHAD
jgi:uncharacterized protein YkuJ